jgi:hypothetical protein
MDILKVPEQPLGPGLAIETSLAPHSFFGSSHEHPSCSRSRFLWMLADPKEGQLPELLGLEKPSNSLKSELARP